MSDLSQYSFTDPDVCRRPYDYLQAMRSEAPVHRDPGSGFYFITRHDDVVEAALASDLFSSRNEINLKKSYSPRVQAVWDAAGIEILDTLVTSDPPEHLEYRRLGMALFTPTLVREMTPGIESLVNGFIDNFIDETDVDFLKVFAGLLPATVIADEYGLPRADQPRFRSWTDAIILLESPGNSEEREIELVHTVIELFRYLEKHLQKAASVENAHKMRVMHSIATMNKRDGTPFSTLERCWLSLVTFVGGNETTINALMHGMHQLARDQVLQQTLRQQPDKIRPFVEEVLRLFPPVQALMRVATRDIDLYGVTIPKGAQVILSLTSANRDESCWQHPERFNLERRDASRQLAFGTGRHVCVGMHLARAELTVAFNALLKRLKRIELSVPEENINYLPLAFFRVLESLPIKIEAA
jgi:cytochrome P450